MRTGLDSSSESRPRADTICLFRMLTALLLFGVGFGFVEAAVVVYLRAIYAPIHQRLYPDRAADDLFPILRPAQLRAEGPEHVRQLGTELVREVATVIMLAAAGMATARNAREWLAAFMIAFGVWDLLYYVFLKLLIDWPATLATWDLLFLLPVPWVGPVWAPMMVSLSMIAAGVVVLWRESTGIPVRLGWSQWSLIAAGGIIVIVAFCWDWRNVMAGGEPHPFNWPLFSLGGGVGLTGFVLAIRPVQGDFERSRSAALNASAG